jgi:hypothetical protein
MASYPQLELDRQLCFALYTASRAVVRAYAPLLDDAGLTYPPPGTWREHATRKTNGGSW